MSRTRTAIFVAPALVFLCPMAVKSSPPLYTQAPVFLELFPNDYGAPENLELMPEGKLKLPPLGTERIDNFDWRHHTRNDQSWWNRVENFFYLSPLLASGEVSHRRFVNAWFEGWYPPHREGEPNSAAWDGMTVGQRAVVLTWILKLESLDPIESDGFTDRLVEAIRRHQEFLLKPANFEQNSNHGMWQALGLLETGRVVPNDTLEAIAFDRLLYLTRKSVSTRGMHKEHSPGYHFVFVKWLGQYVPYLESLYDDELAELVELHDYLKKMRRASYFLLDHANRVPPIGDSSKEMSPTEFGTPLLRTVFVDPEAGFAVFKDRFLAIHARYLVFNIQNKQHDPELPFHYHNDALAIFYSDGGETILDDAGRYSYRDSGRRRFVRSSAAHNTILAVSPGKSVEATTDFQKLADLVRSSRANGLNQFTAEMFNRKVRRTLTVDDNAPGVKVADVFKPAPAGTEFAVLWTIGRDVESIEKAGPARWTLTTKSGRRFDLSVRNQENMAPTRITIVEGRYKPMLGWRAQGFEQLVPAKTIVIRIPRGEASTLTTTIRPLD